MKFYVVAICSLIIDQVTKFLIFNKFSQKPPGYVEKIIGDFFYLNFVKNTGTAFGLQQNMSPWPVLFSTLLVMVLMTYHIIKKRQEPMFMYGLALILGGAMGNLVDRLRLGYVIDFFDFKIWPVFNVADITITAGVIMVIVHLLFLSPKTEETTNDIPSNC